MDCANPKSNATLMGDVRNSLPTRSSLGWGVKAWVLKAEIGCRDDESDEECDDDGLYRQRCEVLSIP